MNCQNPDCQSDDTKTARMAYLTSTTITATKGKNASLSLAASSGVSISGGTSHSTSKGQLLLALEEDIQPPKEPPSQPTFLLMPLAVAAFIAFALMAATNLQSGVWFLVFFAPFGIALEALSQWAAGKAWSQYHERVRLYNKKWICMRCGYTWHIGS